MISLSVKSNLPGAISAPDQTVKEIPMGKLGKIKLASMARKRGKKGKLDLSKIIEASTNSKEVIIVEGGEVLDGGHIIIKIGDVKGLGRKRVKIPPLPMQQPPWPKDFNLMVHLTDEQRGVLLDLFGSKFGKEPRKGSSKGRKVQQPKWKD
jgi:hypothetical protein